MASINKVIIVGNLGRDPENRYLPSGDTVASTTGSSSSAEKYRRLYDRIVIKRQM